MSVLSNEHYQNIDNNNKNNHIKNKKQSGSRFLLQLYKILEEDKYKDIIHWGENGKYFEIVNVHDFTEKILPQYYNHNNYSSFVRQLNMYDFHKKKTNSEEHAFQHSRFIKEQKDLIKTILRKRKKDKNKNITSLIPLVNYNDNYLLNDLNNNYKNKLDLKQNLTSDKHSLSLDEEKDNSQFNVDNIEHSLIEYNKKNYLNDQLAEIQLKQNLMNNNNNLNININMNDNININKNININNNINNVNKKITKKTIYDLLNNLISNTEDNSKKQKILNLKIDSLSNKYSEYINKNNTLLDEIKSKTDYNKKFESVVCFILEIQKIKKEGGLKNILISNDINNNHIHDNSNDLNNLEIINLAEPKKEKKGIVPANEFLQKKTFNNGNIDSFHSFLNKYMDSNKNRGLLTNSETINNNININNNKNEIKEIDNKNNNDINNNNNLLLANEDLKNDNDTNKEDLKDIKKCLLKDNNFDEYKNRSPSIDFTSSIFNRKRSSSFNSLFSNNTNNFNDNFNNNNDFNFKKDEINNTKTNNILCKDNQNINCDMNNFGGNFNKSFDAADLNQDKISERKDSLNNSSISYLDLYNNKSDKMSDIFGGDNNSINFS